MKILAIHGSMRKGNTYALAQAVIARLKTRDDVQITEIGVADFELPFCRSCHTCFTKGEAACPNAGIVGAVRAALDRADGVIISGVTYAMGLNAAMKNLMDHLAYLYHRPAMFGKKGIVVATTAGGGAKGVAKYLKANIGHWGINGARILTHNAQTVDFTLSEKEQKRLDKIADGFYNSIKQNRKFSPSITSLAVHNAFRAMALAASPVSPCDAAYWQSSGFAGKAYPSKIGWHKKAIGSLTYSLMRRVFK
jgi:multimeric flavodoxin WrbA